MVSADDRPGIIRLIETLGRASAIYDFVEETADYVLMGCNPGYESHLAKPRSDATGRPVSKLFPEYMCGQLHDALEECRHLQHVVEHTVSTRHENRERLWRYFILQIAVPAGHRPQFMHAIAEITGKQPLEDNPHLDLERFREIVQYAHDAIISIDSSENIVLFNQAASRIFGYTNEEIIGRPLSELIPVETRKKHSGYVVEFADAPDTSRHMRLRTPVLALRKNGSEFAASITISKHRVGHDLEMTAIVRDIFDETRLIEDLLIASRYDALTGLYNRRRFGELLEAEINRCRRFERGFSLLMLDIDDFKKINDTYGHMMGDQMLKTFGQRLAGMIREMDVVCRWGGEEFVALLPETSMEGAFVVAEKIRSETEAARLNHEGIEIGFTVSIGLAHFASGDGSIDNAIDTVDRSLYAAKKAGKNRVVACHHRQDHG